MTRLIVPSEHAEALSRCAALLAAAGCTDAQIAGLLPGLLADLIAHSSTVH